MAENIAGDVLAHFGIEVDEDSFEHYGKKGMHWGVVNGQGTARAQKSVSADHQKSRELKAKKRSEMSNAELKQVNERLQLEKTNNELQSRTALQKIKTGTQIAGTILAVGATITSAYNFVNSPAGKKIIGVAKSIVEK